jgi:hypothetical protein
VRGVAVALPLAAGLCALWARDSVHTLLPRYDECVSPLRILAFGATGLSLSTFASIVLMTVGRRIILVPAAVFLSALSAGLQLLSLRWNGGLVRHRRGRVIGLRAERRGAVVAAAGLGFSRSGAGWG